MPELRSLIHPRLHPAPGPDRQEALFGAGKPAPRRRTELVSFLPDRGNYVIDFLILANS